MSESTFIIRQCPLTDCRFRFPVKRDSTLGENCPHCGAPTEVVAAHENHQVDHLPIHPTRRVVEALLDNIRSVYNVGSIFRTADGAGISHLHLCGISATPEHPQLAKTSLGAEISIPWTQYRNGVDTAAALKRRGFQLWAIEGSSNAHPIVEAAAEVPRQPVVLVVGNELSGVDPGILELCDRTVWIPMRGQKQSLNVAVAFGIAAYFLCQLPELLNSSERST